ncbi:MAG: hypothetical protein ACR65R_04480 [Methylomicrobium sp.]
MNAICVDGDYYYLFRGDAGLPKGSLPLSPRARRLMWQGRTLEEALEICTLEISSFYTEAIEDGLSALKFHLMQFTEKNHFLNPLVSTTVDLGRAFKYASASPDGYISVLKIHKDRITRFRDHLDIPSTKKENEFGVNGLVLAEEILFQIPLKQIEVNLYLSSCTSSKQEALDFIKRYGIDDYQYNPVIPPVLTCPNCKQPLSPYLREVLGGNSKVLQILQVPKENIVHPFIYANNLTANILAEYGMIARCARCRAWLSNPDKIQSCPLKILKQWIDGKRIFLRLYNTSNEDIYFVVFQITNQKNGESKLYQMDLTKYSHVYFGEDKKILNKVLERAINIFWRKISKDYLKPIAKRSEVVHHIDLEIELQNMQDDLKIDVYQIHFLSGKSWMLSDI